MEEALKLDLRKKGRMKVSVNNSNEAFRALYREIIPIEVTNHFISNEFQIYAVSEHFEPLEDGYIIPEYKAIFKISILQNKQVQYSVSFEKVQ